MPHTLTAARFDPVTSSYWLSHSGRRAVMRIVRSPFWAFRFNLADSREDENNPMYLCIVSPEPSPLPLPNASLTLGPKHSVYTSASRAGDEELTCDISFPCSDWMVDNPLYLHTTPIIEIHMRNLLPVQEVFAQLKKDSLHRFKEAVRENKNALRGHWEASQRARWAEQIADWDKHQISELTFSDLGGDPTYMFGYLNNPQAYFFEFFYQGTMPGFDERPTIYEELFLYAQICKDYRWRGVETVILWIRAARKSDRAVQNANSSVEALVPCTTVQQEPFEVDPSFREIAEELSVFGLRSMSLHEEMGAMAEQESTTHSGDSQYTLVYPLDFDFPELPWEFPEIPLGTPRIVVFDLFGVILDREKAIRCALSSWLPLTHCFQTMEDILPVYIEIEALAARKSQFAATSVAAIVESALHTLARKSKIPLQAHPTLVATALAEIIKPVPFTDVEHAIASLKAHGCPIIVIPSHSDVTMRQVFPSMLRSQVRVTNEPLSMHFAAPDSFFKSLLAQCKAIVPGIRPKDVLLVTSSVARIVAPGSRAEHPTALVKRHGTIASNVKFVVGNRPPTNPVPSIVVEDLLELCTRVCTRSEDRH
ncbi:hypothetical protein C8Q70DRAFT_980988 [Cubamyces menziesii]|nr:hypothetical protein C8Q70DRAFT_980988 [Cubamyces menziesii]